MIAGDKFFSDPERGWVSALRFYCALTGSRHTYGFFSHSLPGQMRVRVELVYPPPQARESFMLGEESPFKEARLRGDGVVSWMMHYSPKSGPFRVSPSQRRFTNLMAEEALQKFPSATAAVLHFERYQPPLYGQSSPEAWHWKEHYSVELARAAGYGPDR